MDKHLSVLGKYQPVMPVPDIPKAGENPGRTSYKSSWVAPSTPNFAVTPIIRGGGNNSNNWNAGGTVQLDKKVSDSVSVGASVTQHFGRQNGHSYKTSPTYGVGVTWRF